MLKFILTCVKYFVLMNLVLYVGAVVVGGPFEFGLITNVVVPVICAFTEYEVRRQKANRALQQR